ncbi:MAG TPA: hypothetical protein VF505_08640 [Thermoanaerobaculia bacterium]
MLKHSLKLFAVALFALLVAAPALVAQNMPITPEVSYFPVTEPTDVGGKVLQPGTYVIRVIQAADSRNKIQVWSQDQKKLYATALTIPHELKPNETMPSTMFVFYEPTADHPRALRTWFAKNPPGDHGHDLVYPEGRAKQIAVASNSRVVSYPETTVENDIATSTLSVQTPQSTVETYTYTPPAPVVAETTTTTVDTTPATPMISSSDTTETKTEMPQTAGSNPTLALLGLAAIAGAVAVRFARA